MIFNFNKYTELGFRKDGRNSSQERSSLMIIGPNGSFIDITRGKNRFLVKNELILSKKKCFNHLHIKLTGKISLDLWQENILNIKKENFKKVIEKTIYIILYKLNKIDKISDIISKVFLLNLIVISYDGNMDDLIWDICFFCVKVIIFPYYLDKYPKIIIDWKKKYSISNVLDIRLIKSFTYILFSNIEGKCIHFLDPNYEEELMGKNLIILIQKDDFILNITSDKQDSLNDLKFFNLLKISFFKLSENYNNIQNLKVQKQIYSYLKEFLVYK
ncbi:hypothetical protein (nucleomorph) [Guillardia theta]|uniref:Uncharacterized protein n=1 Tax=Guillardia theta TaxID=55529 RepID=Q98SD4_GUITH|nr:hypothetical protein GTHECHR3006 [Guillardia theta]AAK39650.1 hypothetical protein [Guillardia theta]|mmetsp:Transcript_18314/g.60159  ORF Transcript_18314/g.60159 Transcript_18314/m.60159 type:complete len:273 (+) Transcript_18314:190-1008(+)